MNDRPEGYSYPERVRLEISQNKLSDYKAASEFLNINHIDVVNLQHEYGIFGGQAGSHILKLLGNLRMPVVTTLHTVLKDPDRKQLEVMQELAELSDKLVVMSHKASQFLVNIYGVREEKIVLIHHGIPDMPFIDPSDYKGGVDGGYRKVILTFGLLSANKGIENVLKALPSVVQEHPDVTYIVLGATHPNSIRAHGEEYRIGLQQLVRKLDIDENVVFMNRFVEFEELCEYMRMADIYITPYREEAQITSGTLIFAMGTGKAVISTPYWYATEMLSDERGIIVPFDDPDAIAQQIIDLLGNDTKRNAIRKKAYAFCRQAVWKEVARRYQEVFSEVQLQRTRQPQHRQPYIDSIKSIANFELPEMKLDYLKTLTDDTGILQHATFTIPDRIHGYCTDDNARALMVVAIARKYLLADNADADHLTGLYLSFLRYAYDPENRRFRNFMSYSRHWIEEVGSEDSNGRALWSLGTIVPHLDIPGQSALCTTLFRNAVRGIEHYESPRAMAFGLVGIHSYLQKFSDDNEVRRIGDAVAGRIFDQFKNNATPGWHWLEDNLNYANGKLPHALLLSGHRMGRNDMTDMALKSLTWLLSIQTEQGHFVPVGNAGWYPKGGTKARFDQQPIEANAMIESCVEAFNITRDKIWIDKAVMCFNWFLGLNDLNMPLYDPKTGGCRDGLTEGGVNQNEGAESSLAWLLSLMTLHKLNADEILRHPSSLVIDTA